jgi:hypothetical protein
MSPGDDVSKQNRTIMTIMPSQYHGTGPPIVNCLLCLTRADFLVLSLSVETADPWQNRKISRVAELSPDAGVSPPRVPRDFPRTNKTPLAARRSNDGEAGQSQCPLDARCAEFSSTPQGFARAVAGLVMQPRSSWQWGQCCETQDASLPWLQLALTTYLWGFAPL